MQLLYLNKLTLHTIVIFILLFSLPVWGDNTIRYDNFWIPESYDKKIESINNEIDLVSNGLAIIIPNPKIKQDNLYILEEEARINKIGLWADKQYQLKTPHTIAGYINSFQIIEGVVLNAALRKGKLYLNFGEDWRTDFTVMITNTGLKQLKKLDITEDYWTNRTIRVRGWIEKYNGPMIKVTNLAQIDTPLN